MRSNAETLAVVQFRAQLIFETARHVRAVWIRNAQTGHKMRLSRSGCAHLAGGKLDPSP